MSVAPASPVPALPFRRRVGYGDTFTLLVKDDVALTQARLRLLRAGYDTPLGNVTSAYPAWRYRVLLPDTPRLREAVRGVNGTRIATL